MINIPVATYRIQFWPSFGFSQASCVIPYLARLGISHLYASPVFKARSGSTHGYDVVDPGCINPELGGRQGFAAILDALRHAGMFLLQDIVPNHMAYDSQNAMLMDVLENGECSAYHSFFDIDWNHPYEGMRGRVLAPFLGTFYADSLENGEISLRYDKTGFSIQYYDCILPLKIDSYVKVLEHGIQSLEEHLSENYSDYVRFLGIVHFIKSLEPTTRHAGWLAQVRHAKEMLWTLYTENSIIRQFVDKTIAHFNGKKGEPDSFSALDSLINEQRYRLAFWKVATEEINYRRFFTVNDLVSVNVHSRPVFNHTHRLIFSLVQSGAISGLRIDHIDGLYDPERYLAWVREQAPDCYMVVEKILAPGERLPPDWQIQGTIGYDFFSCINNIFCCRDNERLLTTAYRRFTGVTIPYSTLLCEKKQLIIGKHLAGNIDNLAQFLKRISAHDRRGLDITLYGLRRALVEVMAHFPVYRTYISSQQISKADTEIIRHAIAHAKAHSPGLTYELDFIQRFLLLGYDEVLNKEEETAWLHFVMSFQQFTGPVMAKGVEDTVFYIYNRLISLNEVGGSPEIFGIELSDFHVFCTERATSSPHSLNATATHDTKRGEDVRARINVLSEVPEEWDACIRRWSKTNRHFKTKGMPDANDEYLIYQTLIGTYPFSREGTLEERIKQYMVKAVREAKVHTAWIKPDTAYEDACISFVENILRPSDSNTFLHDFLIFQRKVAFFGMFNSLSQVLLKITCPGVPDFYQGTELWDLSLVDPDNRRPVNYNQRIEIIEYIEGKDSCSLISELLNTWQDGRVKLFLIYYLLQARRKYNELFQNGEYIPLKTCGTFNQNIITFARRSGGAWAVAIAPRFLTGIVHEGTLPLGADVWQDTSIMLPEGSPQSWKDAITGKSFDASGMVAAGSVLSQFPVALLINTEESV